MHRQLLVFGALAAVLVAAAPVATQTFPTDDPVIRQMWAEGMERSQTYPLAQELFDLIGPRLTGSPGHEAAGDWIAEKRP